MTAHEKILLTTPIGPLVLEGGAKGVLRVYFERRKGLQVDRKPASYALIRAVRWLEAYFSDPSISPFPTRFVDLSWGTPFDRSVWMELMRIPPGQTASYAEIARRTGHPGAARAVGNANRKNSLLILIPCHRVIAADGSIGGYSCGINLKLSLLHHEGVFLR